MRRAVFWNLNQGDSYAALIQKPSIKLAVNNMPRAEEYQDVIAIMPLEQGVFAWVIEQEPVKPQRF